MKLESEQHWCSFTERLLCRLLAGQLRISSLIRFWIEFDPKHRHALEFWYASRK